MDIYLYDDDGVLLGRDEAFLDKRASLKHKRHIFILPRNSTIIKPELELKENQVAVFDGEKWVAKDVEVKKERLGKKLPKWMSRQVKALNSRKNIREVRYG